MFVVYSFNKESDFGSMYWMVFKYVKKKRNREKWHMPSKDKQNVLVQFIYI